jgi:elongation factor P
MNVSVLTWNGRVIDVECPNSVVLKVVDTAGSEKGNTVSGASKPATLETGAVINVVRAAPPTSAAAPAADALTFLSTPPDSRPQPMFINVGEEILVDTRNDIYLSRSGGASFG